MGTHADHALSKLPLTPAQRALCEAFAVQYPSLTGAIRVKFPGTYRWARNTGLDDDDINQQGWLGIIQAAKKFDPDKGIKFVTYALHAARNQVQRPCHDAGRVKRTPLPGVKILSGSQTKHRNRGKQSTLFDLTPNRDPSPDAALTEAEDHDAMRGVVNDLLRTLDARMRKIVYLRIVCGDTLDVVAEAVGISRERVRQVQYNAVRRLKIRAGVV